MSQIWHGVSRRVPKDPERRRYCFSDFVVRRQLVVLQRVESLIMMASRSRCACLLELLKEILKVIYGPFKHVV